MKAIFFCYDENSSTMEKLIDQVHVIALVFYFTLIYLDWTYWKDAPAGIHTTLVFILVFTFLFIRFSSHFDLGKVLQE